MNSADMQGAVAQEVNDRLSKATRELKERYERGEGGQDVSVDGPSGAAYKEKAAKEQQARKERKAAKNAANKSVEQSGVEADVDDEEDAGDGDEDADLRRIREQHLRQMKSAHREKLDNLGKGHGQYREVTQDEFISEMTNSGRVICHFYHRDFPRCKIMDHHLLKLSQTHVETKFVKIDAEKTPFFVEKVRVNFRDSVPQLIFCVSLLSEAFPLCVSFSMVSARTRLLDLKD